MRVQCPHCQNWSEYKNGKCPHCKGDLFDDLNIQQNKVHSSSDSDATPMDDVQNSTIPKSDESKKIHKKNKIKTISIRGILKQIICFLKKFFKWFGILCVIYLAGVLGLASYDGKFLEYGLIRPISHVVHFIKYGNQNDLSHKEFNGDSWDLMKLLNNSDNCEWYAESWPIPTNFKAYDIEHMAESLYKKHNLASTLGKCNWTPEAENEPNRSAKPYKYAADEPGCILNTIHTTNESGTVLWLRKRSTNPDNWCDPDEQSCSEMLFSFKIDLMAPNTNSSKLKKAYFCNPPILVFGFNDDLQTYKYHQESTQKELEYSSYHNWIDIKDRITDNNDQRIEFKLDDELINKLKRKKLIHIVFLIEIPDDGFTSRYLVYRAFSLLEAQKWCGSFFEKR